MDVEPIYHLALRGDWDTAASEYRGSTLGKSLEDVGFVHCATGDQVQQIADLVYRGRTDVVLLKIDPPRLSVPLVYEAGPGGQRFPHIYGSIPTSAIISATPVKLDESGRLKVGILG